MVRSRLWKSELGAALGAMMWERWPTLLGGVDLRVGNRDFTGRLECPVNRHENWFDPVTYVPPATSPVQAAHALAHGRAPTLYRHAGTKVATPGFGHPVSRYVSAASKVGA